ncbi:diaminopimelate decarboxylase [Salsuginibacillus halophilus]|uniref:Diaminopimelate decarboxylase n=1 Tax=Salsuginibacillus halophilus TaxID=517424 RepID=A0A2P8HAP8_9BACI|nr:diaminopimelate decarboxylase [Salsuginibacillus halophilus]PSL43308.1 diaminopimelate decarboxylase [Salsuginibacillus halophilus]
MKLQGTSRINEQGHLEIGGKDTVELAASFGTPLFVYDTQMIRERAQAFHEAFRAQGVNYQIAYASKAFSCLAMLQLADELNLSLDVVSGGELYTALEAGFPMERVHMHGNNKAPEEIDMAVANGVGCFVVDNFHELKLLSKAAHSHSKTVNVMLRTTPGVEAHTHDYISTGQEDSKFGFDLSSGQGDEAVAEVLADQAMHLLGFHCHIGSQIFDTTGFVMAVEKLYSYIASWDETYGYAPEVVNVGGGFGIRYTEDDDPLAPGTYIEDVIEAVAREAKQRNLSMPEIWIEPGRSLVGEAGTTLYTLGSEKDIPGVRRYLSVDGGMTDNIRPALYEAAYEGIIANRADEPAKTNYAIAGKCCESGDMLMWDLPLPDAVAGDLLAVFSTGAYGYAMASNYNRVPRPPVVFVENEEARVVIQGESYADLIKLDQPLHAPVKA